MGFPLDHPGVSPLAPCVVRVALSSACNHSLGIFSLRCLREAILDPAVGPAVDSHVWSHPQEFRIKGESWSLSSIRLTDTC